MIYLDNSASTFVKPKEVIKAMNDALIKYTANPGRSGHQASVRTAMQVQEVREKLACHFNAPSPENIVFTNNCTEALNLAILGMAKQGGHVICTENEHNSVLRPLNYLKSKGTIDYTVALQSEKKGIQVCDIAKHLKSNTYMVICNHISNVNGDKADIQEIGDFCKAHDLVFLVDCAQSGGHEVIDMCKNNIDMLTIAGHKGFYAPQAIGSLILSGRALPEPIKFGGTGTNSLDLNQPKEIPDRYESGTLSSPNIITLGAGVDFVEMHFDEIRNRLDDLTTYLNYELSKLPVEVYTHPENANGVLAFNIPGVHSNDFTTYLDERWNICVRGGYHCAPEKHKALGTLETGAIRISFSYFNTYNEVSRLVQAIKHFLKTM